MGMKALGQSVPGAANPVNVGCLQSPRLAWGSLGPEGRSPTLLPRGGALAPPPGGPQALQWRGGGCPASPTHHGTRDGGGEGWRRYVPERNELL